MNGGTPLNGTESAQPVRTTFCYRRASQLIKDAVLLNEIVMLHGDAGLGKTFAAHEVASTVGRRVASVHCRRGWTTRELVKHLLRKVSGNELRKGRPSESSMLDDLVDLLEPGGWLLLVDEAHYTGTDGLETLRWLKDELPKSFGLVLVAASNLYQEACTKAMLRSRVARNLKFERIPAADIPKVLGEYHPLFAATDDELLRYLDVEHANGNWREWARLLQAVQRTNPKATALDLDLAKLCLAQVK
jgi:DNA transposition AAA+ family ATPase